VPLTISVDSPMTAEDHVSDIIVVAEGNPRPGLATFHLTPLSGRAEASTRIRLAATQNIVVVAKTSKGQLFAEQKPVKVTIGGCGG
jgi:sulfur-oxidizing protein SoxY